MSRSTVRQAGLFGRACDFFHRYGVKSLLCKAASVALRKALRVSIYHVVWLERAQLAKAAPPDGKFTFRFLSHEELARHADDPAYFLDANLVERVRTGRELCFGALDGDRLAAFGFYALHSIEADRAGGVAISFPEDVAFMAFGLTHPDYRGARLHGLIMALALEKLECYGITKLVSLVEWINSASLKSCYRLGYRSLGYMTVMGGAKRAIGIYPIAAKRLGVRFGREATPAECGHAAAPPNRRSAAEEETALAAATK